MQGGHLKIVAESLFKETSTVETTIFKHDQKTLEISILTKKTKDVGKIARSKKGDRFIC